MEPAGDVPVWSVGCLDDEGPRLRYSGGDVLVVPCRQDNLPQTSVEPIACGAPVVAFNIGGLPDTIEDRHTGRLVEPFSNDVLAKGMARGIEDNGRQARLSDPNEYP